MGLVGGVGVQNLVTWPTILSFFFSVGLVKAKVAGNANDKIMESHCYYGSMKWSKWKNNLLNKIFFY
jgi:hypothetical protein